MAETPVELNAAQEAANREDQAQRAWADNMDRAHRAETQAQWMRGLQLPGSANGR
jgi:hypothetical protein